MLPRLPGKAALFIHVPRTGGNSLQVEFRGDEYGGHVPMKNLTSRAVGRFSFAFVRNPWDRLVSVYHFLRDPDALNFPKCDTGASKQYFAPYPTFLQFVDALIASPGEFLKQKHLRPQVEYVCRAGTVLVDFLGRFENYDDDLETLSIMLGRPLPHRHVNGSKHPPYQTLYTPAQVRAVGQIYKHDVNIFGYTFES